jgi:radical SAM protein with 4Fe4S-binding SPASM domain
LFNSPQFNVDLNKINPLKARFKDQINLASKLTFSKVINSWKLLASYYFSKLLKKPVQWGFPASISFEPTTSCNLRCPECPSGLRAFTRPRGMLENKFFEKTIVQLKNELHYLTFYFQGEPYLNPAFLDMVKFAHKNKIYSATSTNGHYLNEEIAQKTIDSGLDRLIISIDGTTQETYESYRVGGKLEKALEGARNVIKAKKENNTSKPFVIFQFLVVSHNEHQIDDVLRLGKEIGVDEVRLKTAQVYDYENGNELIPSIDKYSRYYQKKDGTWGVKNKMINSCWRMWQGCVITWDGGIVPCCFDKDATHQLGQLAESDFKSIWQGQKYQGFRQSILKSRSEIEICKNCTEGTKVWGEKSST